MRMDDVKRLIKEVLSVKGELEGRNENAATSEDWDEEDELDDEEHQDDSDADDKGEAHPAMKFLDACLRLDLVRSTEGRLRGAILIRTTGGPQIEVFTGQRLIVGTSTGCIPFAVSYYDRIGLQDYILDCFSHRDQ